MEKIKKFFKSLLLENFEEYKTFNRFMSCLEFLTIICAICSCEFFAITYSTIWKFIIVLCIFVVYQLVISGISGDNIWKSIDEEEK